MKIESKFWLNIGKIILKSGETLHNNRDIQHFCHYCVLRKHPFVKYMFILLKILDIYFTFILRSCKYFPDQSYIFFYSFEKNILEFLDPGCKCLKWDSGRWTLDAGLWTLGFGCGTLVSRRWTVDPGQLTLDARLWILDSGRWSLDVGFQKLGLGCWALSSGCQALDCGNKTLDTRTWTLDSKTLNLNWRRLWKQWIF